MVRDAAGGLLTRAQAARWAAARRDAGETVVLTNGCFDLLHAGHVELLARAATLGDRLIVALNDDDSVRRLKGPDRPLTPAPERAEILLAVRWVDAVTIFCEDTPLETIEAVRPDVLVKGAEYGAGEIVGEPFVVAHGGRVVRVPMREGHATTRMIERMRAGGGPAGA